ncbi:unnamed protein product [Callosobruchus maculatus]|uniref:Uncharacterized protein n=1 Tax=Callosobruchus maculatus TaxID=64391 RepID=A0A653DLN5_CALMS|nr:unnamed protein product [Callosobruchus maculatus]
MTYMLNNLEEFRIILDIFYFHGRKRILHRLSFLNRRYVCVHIDPILLLSAV